MKNTFRIRIREVGDADYSIIENVHSIVSNLGGFLVSNNEGAQQFGSGTEIKIMGSDDAFNVQIDALRNGYFEPSVYTMSYVYALEHDTKGKRCHKCNSLVLKNNNSKKPFKCMVCNEELTNDDVYEGNGYTSIEFNELCNNIKNLLLLDK